MISNTSKRIDYVRSMWSMRIGQDIPVGFVSNANMLINREIDIAIMNGSRKRWSLVWHNGYKIRRIK